MPHWEKDLIWLVNLEYLVYRIPAKENLVLYVRITFAELKRLDILWGDKQLRRPIWDCGGWVPETSWSYHYWQPAPRWRLHWWLPKPDNPAMSPDVLDKTGTRHTDTQWKSQGWGREGTKTAKHSTHNAPSFRPTDKQALQPRSRGIPCTRKHTNPPDQLTADAPSCLPG